MRITSIYNDIQSQSGERFARSLKIGDVIKGRVVAAGEGRIMLKISAEETINAVVLTDMPIEKDEIIEIIINKVTENKIYAQVIEQSCCEEASKSEVLNILKRIGVADTELNVDVFKALIGHRQPVNKEVIEYVNFIIKTAELYKRNDIKDILNLIFAEKDILNTPVYKLADLTTSLDTSSMIAADNLEGSFTQGAMEDIIKIVSENGELDETSLTKLKQLASGATKAADSIKRTDIGLLVSMLSKNIEITAENLYIYNEINSNREVISEYIGKLLKHLLDSENPKEQLILTKLNEVFLKPEELDDNNVKLGFKKLLELLIQLESSMGDDDKNNYEIRDALMNLRNFVNIIKSINSNMNYIHIPIIVNNKQTDAKIFIYERGKRNKKIDVSNTSIAICLSTDNIGYVESYIEIRDKNINVIFKLENKAATDTINDHKEVLINALRAKGYSISIRAVEKKDEPIGLAHVEEILNPKEVSRYSIDVRV
ncbi:hypothetical protein [Lutispora sp.]|uniref:hypothetical protein n=1 Tax=Lutispora sp. TaxID=2828727 RepID=UPI002B1FEBB0|nr:hypothetical protein [Lutispora sp.]MEA4960098.1 hypothetical protein [Lutispora sp.]